jgi:hypothetical protein
MAVMSALGMVGMWLLWVLTFWITFGVLVVWAVKQWQATTTSRTPPVQPVSCSKSESPEGTSTGRSLNAAGESSRPSSL